MKKLSLLFILLFFWSINYALAFTRLYQEIDRILFENSLPQTNVNLSILFNTKIKNSKIDKIKLKKNIATKINKKYKLVDPINSREIAVAAPISLDNLNSNNLTEFFRKTNSDLLLYTDLKSYKQNSLAIFKIINKKGDIVGLATQNFPNTLFYKPTYNNNSIKLASTSTQLSNLLSQSEPEENIDDFIQSDNIQELFDQSTPKENAPISNNFNSYFDSLSDQQNISKFDNAWFIYTPTAYVPKKRHSLDFLVSIEDLEFANLGIETFRYSLGYDLFEFSTNSITHNNSVNQVQTRIKATVFKSDITNNLNFNIALGLKTRLYRDEEYRELQTEEDQIRENQSIFAVVSTFISPPNLLVNFYLDNYSSGIGVKAFLPYKTAIILDNRYDYLSSNKERYIAIGVEHSLEDYISYSLLYNYKSYQELLEENEEPEQKIESSAIFGIKLTF